MKYINKFETENDVRTAIDNDELLKPYVAYVEDGDYIDWDTHFVDYSRRYLTFKILSGGDIVWKTDNPSITKTISYSFDNGKTWTEIESTEDGVEIPVVPGDKVIFKGTNASYGDGLLMLGTVGSKAQLVIVSPKVTLCPLYTVMILWTNTTLPKTQPLQIFSGTQI